MMINICGIKKGCFEENIHNLSDLCKTIKLRKGKQNKILWNVGELNQIWGKIKAGGALGLKSSQCKEIEFV